MVQLVKDVEFAFAEAYTATVSEYSGLSDAGGREANYRQHFCEELMRIWEEGAAFSQVVLLNGTGIRGLQVYYCLT